MRMRDVRDLSYYWDNLKKSNNNNYNPLALESLANFTVAMNVKVV